VNQGDSDLEEQVLQLKSVGLSTRRIAHALGDVSQSTVVRILQRVNSGPQPIQGEETGTPAHLSRLQVTIRVLLVTVFCLLSVTFMVLTAAVATIAWR
jgi:hypothetical protein